MFPFSSKDNGGDEPRSDATGATGMSNELLAQTTDAPQTTADDSIIDSFTSAAADQVAVMMGEDTRTFMQSMEQIYVAATAKALAMIANEATSAQGQLLLTQINTSQTNSLTFASGTAGVATAFAKV
jgi:hypothetical protein